MFNFLAAKIRFHHMSTDCLASVVTCPLVYESGLIPAFLPSALIDREASKKAIAARKVDMGALKRGSSKEKWTFYTTLSLKDVLSLEKAGFMMF